MTISDDAIRKIKGAYRSNREELRELENIIDENGITDDGISDVSISFEQGYNNALEFVLTLLAIDIVEARKE